MRASCALPGIALLACFSLPAALKAATLSTEEAQQQLSRVQREWLYDYSPETLDRILGDDFVHVLPFAFLNKVDEIENARRHAFNHTGLQYRLEKLTVRVYGVTGI